MIWGHSGVMKEGGPMGRPFSLSPNDLNTMQASRMVQRREDKRVSFLMQRTVSDKAPLTKVKRGGS